MNSEQVANSFTNACRVCFIKGDESAKGNQLVNIFTTSITTLNISLFDLFTAFTALQLKESCNIIGFPTNICKHCLKSLVSAYEFQLKCIKSDQDIRIALASTTTAQDDRKIIFASSVLDPIKVEPNSVFLEEYHGDDSNDKQIKDELTLEKSSNENEIVDILLDEGKEISDEKSHSTKLDDQNLSTYKCPKCERAFLTRQALSGHLAVHKDRVYACLKCPREFCKQRALAAHNAATHKKVKSKTDVRPNQFLCPECGKSFTVKNTLQRHILRHSNIRPFQCDYCPSRSFTKGNLKWHMLTHTESKPHTCDTCGASFGRTSTLKDHMLTHSGEKRYLCKVCDKSFLLAGTLQRHVLRHSGERRHKCEFCDCAYAVLHDLIRHTRSHVGANAYRCNECPAAFRLSKELKKHTVEEHFKKNAGNDHESHQKL